MGAQVGLARRDSPFRGGRYLGLAQALTSELPATLAALRAGDTSEWRATLVARETACLDPADRRVADAELGPALAGLGDREVEAAARAVAYRLDPRAFVDRDQGRQRGPDGDVAAGAGHHVQVGRVPAGRPGRRRRYTALSREADRCRAAGDPRSRGQIMADTLVQRVTGQATAGAVPVEVAAGAARGDPAGRRGRAGRPGRRRPGPGRGRPRPWSPTRTRRCGCAGSTPDPPTARWSRWTPPGAGSPTGLRRLIQTRDRTCRTPWCGAPIRHTDHVIPVAQGGADVRGERARAVRGLQLHQTSPRLAATPAPGPQGPATGSRSPPPPDTPTPATHHPSHAPEHPATTEASSRNTSAASSTPPEHAPAVPGRVQVSGPGELLDDRAELVQVTDEERRDAEAIAQIGELLDEPVVRPDEDVR